jgi:O-antigen/teichoic acid export membrane protein
MRGVLKNIVASWAGLVATALVSFFLTPFILRRLGSGGFGLWVLVSAFTGYYGILDFGLRSAILRYVARHAARQEWDDLVSVISTTLFAFSFLAAFVLIVTCIVAWQFTRVFHISPESIATAKLLVLIVGAGTAAGIPLSVFGGVMEGLQQFTWIGLVQVATVALRAILIVAFLTHGFGVVTLGIISMVLNLVGYIIYTAVSFHECPHLRLRWRAARWNTLHTLLGFGVVVFWIGIAQQLRFQTDAVVIGSVLTVQAIAVFAIGSKLIAYATDAVQALAQVFTPMSSQFDAMQDMAQLRRVLIIGNRYSTFVILPISAVLLICGKSIIRVWVGPNYLAAYSVLAILTIPTALYLAQATSPKVLYGMAQHSVLARVLFVEGVANLLLSIFFAKRLGINGVALGTAIPLACTSILFLPFHLCRVVKLKLSDYFRQAFFYPLCASVPLAMTLWILDRFMQPKSYWELLPELAAGAAVYGVTMLIYFYWKERLEQASQSQMAAAVSRAVQG